MTEAFVWAKGVLQKSIEEEPYNEAQIDEMESGVTLNMLVATALNSPVQIAFSDGSYPTQCLLADIQAQNKQYNLESASSTKLITCWIWYVNGKDGMHEVSAVDLNVNVAICKAIVKDWLGFNDIS